MKIDPTHARAAALACMLGLAVTISACGGKEPAATTPAAATDAATQPASDASGAADAESAQPLAASDATWTPEELEGLLAPVALYPDVVLGQVLVASTNPQEVLDAGNWLLQNQGLEGKPLDQAAEKVGFTPPIRGLIQSPEVVDMMASQMDWTTELGQAYVNDQDGVLAAVQRLRAQAQDVGNLQTSKQMKVETEVQEGQQVITVSPPSPEVVYVPQYDPVAAYAPPPATAPVAMAPATTTTTTTTTEDNGHSTGSMVATGLLAFGAGLVVSNIFDDDDDDWYGSNYYSPRYYGPPAPYYPPYPYRPAYGNGYYPNNNYNRPPGYQHGFNNNTVIVNQDNNYWNNFDNKSGNNRKTNKIKSPITEAKPNRPELQSLNTQAKQGPKRAAPSGPDSWKGQSGYAGNKQGGQTKAANARPGASTQAGRPQPKVQGSYAGAKPSSREAPKVQGGYAGAKPQSKPQSKMPSKPATNNATRPATMPAGAKDRGYSKPTSTPTSRTDARPASKPAPSRAKPTAMSGAGHGGSNHAASQRGKQSMPKGVPPKAKSGGGKRR